jgi:hypothetical protein
MNVIHPPLSVDDLSVLTASLRRRTEEADYEQRSQLQIEIGLLIDLAESIVPRDTVTITRLEVARSLVVLGRYISALNRVDSMLRTTRM